MSSTPLRKAAVTGAAVVAVLFGSAAAASAQTPAESTHSVTVVAEHSGHPHHHGWAHGGPRRRHHCRRWHGGWRRDHWCGRGYFHHGFHPHRGYGLWR
ncbi:MAG: hypothetical protein JO362_16930 [Streptomycetaceae bacterium]|nr:hypothetical protein [Streptomycetaceae bacterium]